MSSTVCSSQQAQTGQYTEEMRLFLATVILDDHRRQAIFQRMQTTNAASEMHLPTKHY